MIWLVMLEMSVGKYYLDMWTLKFLFCGGWKWILKFWSWWMDDRHGYINSWKLVLCEVPEHVKIFWGRRHCDADISVSVGCTVSLFIFTCCDLLCMMWEALEYTHKCICIYLWSGISVVKASVFVRYDGSIGLASRAMASVDQLVSQLNR